MPDPRLISCFRLTGPQRLLSDLEARRSRAGRGSTSADARSAGYGMSERPNASYELGWHAHVMAKWLEAVGLDKVDIVGHSFGGGVAQVMLLECPTKIRRLVLVASGGLGRQIAPVLRLASVPRVVELFGQRFMAFGTRLALGGTGAGILEAGRDRAKCHERHAWVSARVRANRAGRDRLAWPASYILPRGSRTRRAPAHRRLLGRS